MMRPIAARVMAKRAGTAAVLLLSFHAAPALAQSTDASVDATVVAGYARNPFLESSGDTGAAYVEATIAPRVELTGDKGQSEVDGYYSRTQYLSRYGASSSYGAGAGTNQRINPKFDLHFRGSFDSSILGEQTGVGVVDTTLPIGAVSNPLGPDITLFGLRERQTSYNASGGFTYRLSEKDRLTADFNGSLVRFGGDTLSNYHLFGGAVGYSRSLSESKEIGFRFAAQKVDYDRGGETDNIYEPQLTFASKLSPSWRLSAALGLLLVDTNLAGVSKHSTGVSGDLRLCHDGERSKFCVHGSRDAQATGLGAVSTRFDVHADYSLRVNANDTLHAAGGYSRVSQSSLLPLPLAYSYGDASLGYEHVLSHRFTVGATAAYRDAFGSTFTPPADLAAYVFLRARFGKLQ